MPLPHEGKYLWDWFNELSAARGGGGFSISPITYTDIRAWRLETGTPQLLPYEVQSIKALDSAFISFHTTKEE